MLSQVKTKQTTTGEYSSESEYRIHREEVYLGSSCEVSSLFSLMEKRLGKDD